jgi:hypothetical protein
MRGKSRVLFSTIPLFATPGGQMLLTARTSNRRLDDFLKQVEPKRRMNG